MSTEQARRFRRQMSPPEARMWIMLRLEPLKSLHFRRQVPIGPYYADFASHAVRLVIEVDGGMHFTDHAAVRDAARDRFIDAQGYRVLRFTTPEVLNGIDEVYRAICSAAGIEA